jgi:hypothetical protein
MRWSRAMPWRDARAPVRERPHLKHVPGRPAVPIITAFTVRVSQVPINSIATVNQATVEPCAMLLAGAPLVPTAKHVQTVEAPSETWEAAAASANKGSKGPTAKSAQVAPAVPTEALASTKGWPRAPRATAVASASLGSRAPTAKSRPTAPTDLTANPVLTAALRPALRALVGATALPVLAAKTASSALSRAHSQPMGQRTSSILA